MFADLFKRLTAPDPAPLSPSDARVALGALLVRLARSDGNYDADEVAQIDAVLATRYGLSEAEAASLRAECETAEQEAPDTVRFTRAIKDAVPFEDRIGVIEGLWSVVLADGKRDKAEDALLRMVAPMLGVSDQDSHAARLRVSSDS
ncbi:tellurite resistance TerB family protein [Pseudooctadecabacter jejudonensis]|uniref:Tellurite resistance protein TerB n=1 Tax=Pseudooctadecabacter jejudonensis TaxID=1391910 RepID=A0A1Y5RRW2_9RHOB|nr:TerB family tellurite resistance protein [Pseudooctadecabacter jejudonensis]SLN21105.1 Tellurite resistance protein TerB [Pseudooctadecabacter jejudonensis]